MASTQTIPASSQTSAPPGLLVSLVSQDHDSLTHLLANLAAAFPGERVIVATPDGVPASSAGDLEVVSYTPVAPSSGTWTLTAADFLNAHELAGQHGARAILQLGEGAHSLEPGALRNLAQAILTEGADLAVPHYHLPATSGLVNSAILYPLTRALFGVPARYPLAIDLCLSTRAAERLATTAQRFTSTNQLDALIWPVIECAVAGFTITETDAGPRTIPQPGGLDLNALLAHITGSLFTEVDNRAAFWQRTRVAQSARATSLLASPTPSTAQDIQPMLDAFRLAYGNLHEIWSLVLPPHSLLGLKRLSVMPAESFSMPDALWARIVYDFVLAFRLRTLNRGHLLGALTPLYLAWVASHILQTSASGNPERHIEAVAAAFEADKPYLVSRWRWPDRFNP